MTLTDEQKAIVVLLIETSTLPEPELSEAWELHELIRSDEMNVYDKNHPHNAVFVAQLQSVIDGAPRVVQIQIDVGPEKHYWKDVENDSSGTPQTEFINILVYRLKPATVTRTLTYPEPLRVAPALGTMVWILNPGYSAGFSKGIWAGYSGDKIHLRRGFVFATASDAAEAAQAIFGGGL